MICISLSEEVEKAFDRYFKFCNIPSVIIYDFVIEGNLYELWGNFVKKIKSINEEVSPKIIILTNENLVHKNKLKPIVLKIPQDLFKIKKLKNEYENIKDEILFNYFIERMIKPTHHRSREGLEFFKWFTSFKGAYLSKSSTLNSYYRSNFFKDFENMCLIEKRLKGESTCFKNVINLILKIKCGKANFKDLNELEKNLKQITSKGGNLWRHVVYSW